MMRVKGLYGAIPSTHYVNLPSSMTVREFINRYVNLDAPTPTATIAKRLSEFGYIDIIADDYPISSLSEDILDMNIIHAEYRPKCDETDGPDGHKFTYQKVGYFYWEVLG